MMKKIRIQLLLILALLAGIGSYAYQQRHDLTMNPLEASIPVHSPYKIKTDDQDNVYVIHEAKRNLLKIGGDGTIQDQIEPPPLETILSLPLQSGSDSLGLTEEEQNIVVLTYEDLVVDSQGYLYALLRVMDENVLLLRYEMIVRYTPDGLLDESWGSHVRAYDVEESESLSGGTIYGLEMRDDRLYRISQEKDDELLVHRWVPDAREWQKERSAYIKPGQYLANSMGIHARETFYATQSGEVYDDDFNLLYPLGEFTKEQPNFAEGVQRDSMGNLYFLDEYGHSIKRLHPNAPNDVEEVVAGEDVQKLLFPAEDDPDAFQMQTFGLKADGSLVIAMNDRMALERNGTLTPFDYSFQMRLRTWGFWAALAVGGVLLLLLCKILYVDIMPRSLLYKQLFIVVPVVVGMMMALTNYLHQDFEQDTENEVRRALTYVAHDGQNLVPGGLLSSLQSPRDFMSQDYQTLKSKLNFEDHLGKYYMIIHKYIDNRLYSVVQDDNDFEMFSSFEVDVRDSALTECKRPNPLTDEFDAIDSSFNYWESLEKHEYITCKSMDEDGTWLFALGPLFNADKSQVVGVYEAGINMYAFERRMQDNWNQALTIIAGITALVLLTILAVTMLQLKSIRRLRSSVSEVASGNWDISVRVSSRDEVADLGNRFNEMARYIQGYVEEITVLRDSYYRFVPQSFLNLLGKQNIIEVELGDAVQQEASVLVTSIRSFRVMSKDMTPEDNFQFINGFLQRVSPVVHRNGGLINKYLGDGVLALFPHQPGEALRAGIDVLRELEEYNASREQKGKVPVHVGIGINHGPMMLGIIGAEQRLEGSVLSDAVNFATLLEELSEQLGANLLIPAHVMQGIPEAGRYLSRTLGQIQLAGLDQAVELIDVFEADDEESRRLKLKTREIFERAIIMYQQGRFYDAREAFLNVIKQNPNDKTAKLYFYIADANFQNGMAGEWNGTLPV